jgi:hypothetical protein
VVAALATVTRGQPGRNAGDNDDTTRPLSGRSGRVLAFGLAFVISARRMTIRDRAAGKSHFCSAKPLCFFLAGEKSFCKTCWFRLKLT